MTFSVKEILSNGSKTHPPFNFKIIYEFAKLHYSISERADQILHVRPNQKPLLSSTKC